MGSKCGEHTFGKTGFTGTLCICDVEKGVAYVILSNRIYPKRPADSSAINAVRADLGEIILS
jgi:CubicO group peptidase (beta-lactamase class C family)